MKRNRSSARLGWLAVASLLVAAGCMETTGPEDEDPEQIEDTEDTGGSTPPPAEGSGFGDIVLYVSPGGITSRGCTHYDGATKVVIEGYGEQTVTGSHSRDAVTCGTSGVVTYRGLPEGYADVKIYCKGTHVATQRITVKEDQCTKHSLSTP